MKEKNAGNILYIVVSFTLYTVYITIETSKEHYFHLEVESLVQNERLGLGHAANLARKAVGDDDVLIIYGNTIIPELTFHERPL